MRGQSVSVHVRVLQVLYFLVQLISAIMTHMVVLSVKVAMPFVSIWSSVLQHGFVDTRSRRTAGVLAQQGWHCVPDVPFPVRLDLYTGQLECVVDPESKPLSCGTPSKRRCDDMMEDSLATTQTMTCDKAQGCDYEASSSWTHKARIYLSKLTTLKLLTSSPVVVNAHFLWIVYQRPKYAQPLLGPKHAVALLAYELSPSLMQPVVLAGCSVSYLSLH